MRGTSNAGELGKVIYDGIARVDMIVDERDPGFGSFAA